MRHISYIVPILLLASHALAMPDGGGGHHGGGHGHHTDHAAAPAPASGYQTPSTGYAQPSSGYDTPSTGYEQPADAYAPPSTGYDTPSYGGSTGYEAGAYDTSGGYDTAGGYEVDAGYGGTETESALGIDPSMLIIPILIIAGLALLFPQVVTVGVNDTGKRKKREAGDTTSNLVERIQDMYMAVMESEECLQRVACEAGGIAEDAGINMNMSRMAESFVPKKYQKMMKNFNNNKDCHKIKCGAF